jgi:hypothetical protein
MTREKDKTTNNKVGNKKFLIAIYLCSAEKKFPENKINQIKIKKIVKKVRRESKLFKDSFFSFLTKISNPNPASTQSEKLARTIIRAGVLVEMTGICKLPNHFCKEESSVNNREKLSSR